MKLFKILGLFSLLGLTSLPAQAQFIDFNTMAERYGSHGESAWDSLNLSYTGFSVSISATKNGNAAYAYLDSSNAGLGVCGGVYNTSSANKITHSSSNLCNPSSDDNVTTGEALFLTFNTDVIIDNLWFNNNHDSDYSLLGDTISMGGTTVAFNNGGVRENSAANRSFFVAAGTAFEIAYFNDAFYLDSVDVRSVPETTSLIFLLVGLLGLFLLRKRIV